MAKFLSKAWVEELGDVFEPTKMSQDYREDFTAAVMFLHAKQDDAVPEGLTAGMVMLGGELGKGKEKDNWVYWVHLDPDNRNGVKLSEDWGKWRKAIDLALKKYGLSDPRTDEATRTWTGILQVAGTVVGTILVAIPVTSVAGAAVLAGVNMAAGGAYKAADANEQKFADALALEGVEMDVTGSAEAAELAGTLADAAGDVAGGIAGGVADGSSVGDIARGAAKAAMSSAGRAAMKAGSQAVQKGPSSFRATEASATELMRTGQYTPPSKLGALVDLAEQVGAPAVLAGIVKAARKKGMADSSLRAFLALLITALRAEGISV